VGETVKFSVKNKRSGVKISSSGQDLFLPLFFHTPNVDYRFTILM